MNPADDAIALVRKFGAAWDRRDVTAVMAMLSEDAVYENVPLPAMVGHDEIRRFIAPALESANRMDWQFLAAVADVEGRRVLTERVDTFFYEEGNVAVKLMGIFELADGRIHAWRDYADLAGFMRDMAAIGRAPGIVA